MRYAVDLRHPLQAPCGGHDFELRGMRRQLSSLRGRGNVGIPKGFPKSVGRVGRRLHAFPPFPYSVISMACFLTGRRWATATSISAMCRTCKEVLIVIVSDECFGDLHSSRSLALKVALHLLPKNQRHIAPGFLQQLFAANADFATKLQTLQQVNEQTASYLGGGCPA